MGFGKNLKNVLIEVDMSVADLSRITEIPPTTLYSIINKDIDNVGLDKVKRIEKAVGAIPGSIIHNLLYDINSKTAEVSTRQYDFYSLGDDTREYLTSKNYHKLNIKGQVKVAEYTEDLTKIPEYQKPED